MFGIRIKEIEKAQATHKKILLQSPYHTLCLYHFLFYPRYGQLSPGLIILNSFWKKEIEIDLPL